MASTAPENRFDRSSHRIPGGSSTLTLQRTGGCCCNVTFDGGMDIWLSSGIRGELTRATDDTATEWCPVWAPGGRQFAFASNRTGVYDLYRKPVAGPEEVLLKSSDMKIPTHWSRDGRFILYRVQQETRSDLWVLPLTSGEKPFPFVQTRFDEREGQFSPDTRWVAYQSDESGRYQIYSSGVSGPRRTDSGDGGRRNATTMAARWTGTFLHLAGREADGVAGGTECGRAAAPRAGASPALSDADQRRGRARSEPATVFRERRWPAVSDEHQGGGRRSRASDYDGSQLEAGEEHRPFAEMNVSSDWMMRRPTLPP